MSAEAMTNMRITEWRKIAVSLSELCLDTTLRCGQSFRWKKLDSNEWSCVLHGRILSLKQDSTHLHYRAMWPITGEAAERGDSRTHEINDENTESLIRTYLNLTPNLTELYKMWSKADANFKRRAPKFTGVRILKQDAWEALVGFICSSNNNIARISQMVHNLCIYYGPLIGYINDEPFHDFPQPEALAGPGVEAHLRQIGFGYRAKYLAQTAAIIANEKEPGWLDSLGYGPPIEAEDKDLENFKEGGRNGYRKAHEELLQLQGVGPKVADCVCLMGLGWGEAVPVDTHVWQIAQRDYKFGKGKHKSLTKVMYDSVGDHFRGLWGKEAGWAHSVLFAADLRTFAIRLTTNTEVKVEEIAIKDEDGHESTKTNGGKRRRKIEVILKEESAQSIISSTKKSKLPNQRNKR